MSTEEAKEELEREEKIPPYFDRYVASELRALGQRITDLKAIMDERFVALKESMDEHFAHIEARFAQVDRRFDESREYVDMRFEEVNQRFDGVNQRFEEVNQRFEGVNQRFDKLESTLKWGVGLLAGLFVPVIVGILAIIIKMFFSGKFSP
ncbi:MAG: hypothetical protein ACE5PV_12990 [Candidatus Poribacteria bacterium]